MTAAGTEQDDGNFISLTANFSGSVLDGKNPVTGEYRYKAEGGDWSGFSPLVSGEPAVFAATGDATFTVQVQVSDTFSSFTQDIVVNSIRFIMDFKAGGTGVSFGKAAEYDDTLDCNWEGHFRKNVQVDGSLSVGIPAAGERGVRLNNHLWLYYNEDETPTAHIYQPYAQKLSFSIRNGTGEPSDLEWMGENGGSNRYILRPMENGGAYLGTTSMRWNTGFFTNTITQSDLKDKENIREISGAKGFIMALQPIAYTLKDGDGGRVHMGFGAQQVAQAAAEHGMGDLSLYQAVVVEPDGSEHYFREGVPDESLCWGLNYSELIAPPCPDGTGVGNPAFPDGTGRPWAVRPDKRNGGMLMSIMHKVKWGDTLWDLSRKYGVSIDAIVKANKQIKDPHWIYTGDTLVIPTGSSSSSSSSGSSSSSSGKTSKPPSYETGKPVYKASSGLSALEKPLAQLEAQRPGEYNSPYSDRISQLVEEILNRPEFSYDLNANPVYRQYRTQYMQAGQSGHAGCPGTGVSPFWGIWEQLCRHRGKSGLSAVSDPAEPAGAPAVSGGL